MSKTIHVTRLSPALVPPISSPKRTLRNQDFTSCTVYSHVAPGRAGNNGHALIYVLDQAISSLDWKGAPPFSMWRAQSTSAAMIPDFASSPYSCDLIHQKGGEEVAYEHAKQSQDATQQAVEPLCRTSSSPVIRSLRKEKLKRSTLHDFFLYIPAGDRIVPADHIT